MPRDRHQRKQVEQALQRAEAAGFTIDVLHSGHRWGRVNATASTSRSGAPEEG
ncbi:MAG: hypothetical protein M3063_03355 [Actinomycetota bacterium]|nr:hypothetical protein [Actinomycetota bacterium]